MGWLSERRERRAAAAAPQRLVAGAEHVVDADPATVFAFLADPANVARMSGDPRGVGAVVPGRPDGVGARHVVARPPRVGDAVVGTVREVVAHEPGHRFATRDLGVGGLTRTFFLHAVPGGTRVVAERAAETSGDGADLFREGAAAAAAEGLGWLAHHLTGAPQPPPAPRGRARRRLDDAEDLAFWQHTQRAVVRVRASASVDVPSPALRAWAAVAEPGHASLWSTDPDALGFVLPGAAAGQVGAWHCRVEHTGAGLIAVFDEVVEAEVGRRHVVVNRSTSHVFRTEVTVEAVPGGSRLTASRDADLHCERVPGEAAVRSDLERALDGLARVLAG